MTSNHDIGHHKLVGIIEEKLAPIIEQVIDSYGLAGLGVGIRQRPILVRPWWYFPRLIPTIAPMPQVQHSILVRPTCAVGCWLTWLMAL
jgi:hypothetical protein